MLISNRVKNKVTLWDLSHQSIIFNINYVCQQTVERTGSLENITNQSLKPEWKLCYWCWEIVKREMRIKFWNGQIRTTPLVVWWCSHSWIGWSNCVCEHIQCMFVLAVGCWLLDASVKMHLLLLVIASPLSIQLKAIFETQPSHLSVFLSI